jgi:hypothetical protein
VNLGKSAGIKAERFCISPRPMSSASTRDVYWREPRPLIQLQVLRLPNDDSHHCRIRLADATMGLPWKSESHALEEQFNKAEMIESAR